MTDSADIAAFDVAAWPPDEEYQVFPEGSREKRLLRCPEPRPHPVLLPGHRYLFKKSRRIYPQQFWAEVVAYHVGRLCDVPVVPTFPAFDSHAQDCGALIEWFYGHGDRPKELFVSGGPFMKAAIKDYDFKRGRQHNFTTIEMVCRVLVHPHARVATVAKLDAGWLPAWARLLTFDALIGHTDRHPDGWGFLVRRRRDAPADFRLAPAFGNGTSLGHEWSEDQITDFDDPQHLHGYIHKGRHHMRWHQQDARQAGHAELLRKLIERHLRALPVMQKVLAFDDAELEQRLIALSKLSVPIALSPQRAGFMLRLLRARRDYLLNALAPP